MNKYIKEIDSLRAFAILGVIFTHWAPGTLNRIPWGAIGVHFFFVLSGFLITKILIDSKLNAEESNSSKFLLIKNFYIRRALRIFPIYYLLIFILFLFKKYTAINFNEALIYCLTYTTNFYFIKIGEWQGEISHLWSLAVEEQFYLLWPWVIIFVKKKYLLHAIISFIIIGIFSEYYFSSIPKGDLIPLTCFDGFGLGALLAWFLLFKNEKMQLFYRCISIIGVSSFIVFIFILVSSNNYFHLSLRLLTFLFGIWILAFVVKNTESNNFIFNTIFRNKILLFIGKISYGMYLYHFMIPSMINTPFINKYINPLFPNFLFVQNFKWLFFSENFILLILISWFSYYFIEKRFLNLKTKFVSNTK